MIKLKDFIRHEFIDLEIEVVDSTNKSIISTKGKVVDETRNTLKIETSKGEKTFVKDQCTFLFHLGKDRIKVDGKVIVSRPEDRIKKKVKKW